MIVEDFKHSQNSHIWGAKMSKREDNERILSKTLKQTSKSLFTPGSIRYYISVSDE